MFHNLAVDIAFLLIKNKIVDIEQRDIYVYGLEVIITNNLIHKTYILTFPIKFGIIIEVKKTYYDLTDNQIMAEGE